MSFGISAATWLAGAATVGGAYLNKKGTDKAVNAQADAGRQASADTIAAQREAQAFQQKQVDQARADQEPWRVAGGNALTQLSQRTAPGGDLMGQSNAFARPFNFQADPGYAFRQAEGQKAVTNSAAGRGMLLSGAAAKAIQARGQDIASAEYGNAYSRYQTDNTNQFNRDETTQTNRYNRLATLAGVGQVAANQTGQQATQFGNNVGNALMDTAQNNGRNTMDAGNVRASSYMGQANTWGNMLNQGVSIWNNRNSGGTPNAQNVTPTYG